MPTCTAADIRNFLSLENRTYDYLIFLTGITSGKTLNIRHLVVNYLVCSVMKTANKEPFKSLTHLFDMLHETHLIFTLTSTLLQQTLSTPVGMNNFL